MRRHFHAPPALWSRHEAHVTVEPFYKGMGPLSLIQWSLSTRDKLGTGQLSLIQWNLSTRDKLGMGLLSLIQWSLSTRDKLGTGQLSLIHAVEPLYKGQVGDGSFVPYTVEPLYKGQFGGGSFVLYRVQGIEGLSSSQR